MVLSCSLLLLTICSLPMHAADLLPATSDPTKVIDHSIDAALKTDGIIPAPPADDLTWLRRVTLDLVGRIPTAREISEFRTLTAANKRVAWVERLLASPGFVRHLATEFDALLLPEKPGGMRDYLIRAFSDDRRWDGIFRDVVLADESDPKAKGASEFLRRGLNDLDKLTNDISVAFFGVNVSCARCHDHPLVEDWKQDHFFGMKSFFARSYDAGSGVGERDFGLVKFQTTKGVNKQAQMMFLTGKVIDAPNLREPTKDELKKEKEMLEQAKKNKQLPPKPTFSARAKLVETALAPDQREFFAKSLVNRVWYRLLGHGIVMPLDQMHSENPPSHPELLAWLARDTAEHQYDLRRLIRAIVLSEVYGRSSEWPSVNRPAANTFAVAQVRALTPLQMSASMRIAVTDPARFDKAKDRADFEKLIEQIESAGRGSASLFAQPNEDFRIGVSEALMLSNSPKIQQELLTEGSDKLVTRLKEMKDDHEAVRSAVRTVLCREPHAEEIEAMTAYIAAREKRRAEAWKQIIWALIASAEFRFNY